MNEIIIILLTGIFLPLFPMSMVFNAVIDNIKYTWLRACLYIAWPLSGIVILLNSGVIIPGWLLPLALGTSALYAFRMLTLREVNQWSGFLATSLWSLLWIAIMQDDRGILVYGYALSMSVPLVLLVLLAGGLEQRFGAAYTGLYAGLARTIPRFSFARRAGTRGPALFRSIFLYDGIACFAYSCGNGVYIYDLSSPLSPELVREYHNQLPGDYLIGKSQDYVVDRNGKAEPIVGLPYFSGIQSRFGFGADNIVVRDEYAYVFGDGRLWIFDVSQSLAPEYVADIPMWSGSRDTVIIHGDYLYSPRQIFDISQVSEPSMIKTLGSGFYTGVAIKDNYLITVKWEALEIFDIQTPSEATLIKSIPFEERVNKVFVHNGIIYLGFYEGKLRSCVLENDMTLTTLDEIQLAATEWGLILDLSQENDLLYVALNGDGIASVNIEDPFNLKIYARFNTSQYSEQIKVFNGYAYVADGSGGTLVIDMLTRGFEKKIASYPTTDWTRAIEISEGYVYTCEGDNGVVIFASDLLNAN